MDDYHSVRQNFTALLRWHVKVNGTRPDGSPDRPGKTWKAKELAIACNVGDPAIPHNGARTVRFWFREKSPTVPPDLDPIELALMGENAAYDDWRRDLRNAHRSAAAKKRSTQKQTPAPTVELSEGLPRAPKDIDAFRSLASEGLFEWNEEVGMITPYFLHVIWLRCCSLGLISSIITPPTGPIDLGGYIAERESLVKKFLDHLVLPELREPRFAEPEISKALAEATYHVHRKLRTEASRLGLINVRSREYFVSKETLEGTLSSVSADLNQIQSRAELSRRFLDALDDEVSARMSRVNGDDPRFIEILGLFLFAVAHDCREITVTERSWRFFQDGLKDNSLFRWGAYGVPFNKFEPE